MRQLVANLVLNGIRHNLDADGWVEIRTESEPDGSVEIVVLNSGPVVSPELLVTLTEPFVRGVGRVTARTPGSRGSHEGSGLGLALVARVAAAHGAVLRLDAPAEGGLVVRVRFPAPGNG